MRYIVFICGNNTEKERIYTAMKKKTAALIAALALICLSGCDNGNNKPADTTTKPQADENGRVTAIAMEAPEAPDTSAEALEYLERVAPKFKKFAETRRTTPLTLETTIEQDGKIYKSNVYVKDEYNAALTSVSPDGVEKRVIYAEDKAYQIEPAEKQMYIQTCGEDLVKTYVKSCLLPLDYEYVKAAEYIWDTDTIDGVEYNTETITSDEVSVVYYFDKETDEIVYTKSAASLTKFDKLTNTVDNEAAFEVPTDYTELSYEDLLRKQAEALGINVK